MAPPKKDRRMERVVAIAKLRFGDRWAPAMSASAEVSKALLSMVQKNQVPLTDAAYAKLLAAIDREIIAMDKASEQVKRIRALMEEPARKIS